MNQNFANKIKNKSKRNAQIYTGYLKFIYKSKMNSFSCRKSTNIYKIKCDIQTADSFDSTIDFPSLLMSKFIDVKVLLKS